MNRPTPPGEAHDDHRQQRERELIAALRKQGIAITLGVLVDERHNRQYRHSRIVEIVRSA